MLNACHLKKMFNENKYLFYSLNVAENLLQNELQLNL
jgi:hypothetical protein